MGLFNLLDGGVSISLFGQTYDVALNWIGTLIKNLTIGVGSVGVGIILFSLILKIIVLPFDIYQRVVMRKQNQKMSENKERMEKLQKQYANDKQMYNQKVMEMYKESGISLFSSCLPMILSMIIFFVAIGAFNTYSQYSNIENYNLMVNAYNKKMESYAVDLNAEDTTYVFKSRKEINADKQEVTANYIVVSEADKEIYFEVKYAGVEADATAYKTYVSEYKGTRAYYIDKSKLDEEAKTYVETKRDTHIQNGNTTPFEEDDVIRKYFEEKAQNAVVSKYKTEVTKNTGFLWIKNIWATDAVYKHPVLSFKDFSASMAKESFKVEEDGKVKKVKISEITSYTDAYQQFAYDQITGKLSKEKSAPNGYFILIALSIGSILLQQFVSMRSQKEQQKYSSVDGQSGSQQKMMLIMMTGMFAIFSFMYSSAFTIYMITSNMLSLVSTLIINKAVDASAQKKEEKAFQEKYNRRFPRQQTDGKTKNKKK